MKTSRENHIEDIAAELLERLGGIIPVDVEGAARNLNITVRKSSTEDDISGFLLRQHGIAVIGVNVHHHPNRQRFTIAHEIGHFLLHKQDAVYVDRVIVKLRDSKSSRGENIEEVEANRFAAALLMPKKQLDQDVLRNMGRDLNDERFLQQLAKKYCVSVLAMTNRLTTLGYI